jgi:hypothetical protein
VIQPYNTHIYQQLIGLIKMYKTLLRHVSVRESHHKAEAFQLMQLFSNKHMYYILLLCEYIVFYEPDKLSSSLYGNGDICLKVKRPQLEGGHSLPSGTKIKNA